MLSDIRVLDNRLCDIFGKYYFQSKPNFKNAIIKRYASVDTVLLYIR